MKFILRYLRLSPFLFLLIIFFVGCDSATKKAVVEYEQNQNYIQVTKVRFQNEWTPFYAIDSLLIVQEQYEDFFLNKIESLDQYISDLKLNLSKSEIELKDITNPVMRELFEQVMNGIAQRIKKIERVKQIYQNQPEKTQCQVWLQKIAYYQQADSLLLGYTKKAQIIGVLGLMEPSVFQRTYFFDVDKKSCLGELTLPYSAP